MSSEQQPCSKCNGTGWYQYDHNHAKVCEGLRAGNVEMASGHRVDTPTHAIRWVMEQLQAKM